MRCMQTNSEEWLHVVAGIFVWLHLKSVLLSRHALVSLMKSTLISRIHSILCLKPALAVKRIRLNSNVTDGSYFPCT